MPKIPEPYDGKREYKVETHGPTSTFYMHITPEIRMIIEELNLVSSEGGFTPLYIPNGDLPPAVIIHNDKKTLTLKNRLEAAGYNVKNSSNLEGRMQQ